MGSPSKERVESLVEKYSKDSTFLSLIEKGKLSDIKEYTNLYYSGKDCLLYQLVDRFGFARKGRCRKVINPVLWNELTAYLYGLILADGCVGKPRNGKPYGPIEIQLIDSSLINTLKYKLGLTYKSQQCCRGDSTLYRLRFTSSEWYKVLLDLGLRPNKSYQDLNLAIPPEEYVNHFIRGLFDGDGSIHYTNRCGGLCGTFQIYGRKNHIEQIQRLLPVEFSITDRSTKSSIIRMLSVRKLESLRILYEWLYSNSTIFLDRKKLKFEEFFLKRKEYESLSTRALKVL